MVYNPSNCIFVREDDQSCSNHMQARIPNSLINELFTLKVSMVIIIKYGVNSGPIQLVSFTHLATGIREDTEIWVFDKHVFLEVFAPGNLGCFGCFHVLFECSNQKLKLNYKGRTVSNSNCEKEAR